MNPHSARGPQFGWDLFKDVLHTNPPNINVGKALSDVGKWTSNAVSTAGKDIGQATKTAFDTVGRVTADGVKDIGQAGQKLETAFDAAGKAIAKDAQVLESTVKSMEGVVSKAMDGLKTELKIIKDIAPFAQMVISMVPGIGTGISAAIGGCIALAEGQSLADALVAGIKGALPGAPVSGAALEAVGKAVDAAASHKPFKWNDLANDAISVGGSAIGLPDEAAKALETAITTAAHIATGQNVASALAGAAVSEAGTLLPQASGALGSIIPQNLIDSASKLVPQNLSTTALGPVLKVADDQFHKAVAGLPKDVQNAVTTALAVHLARKRQAAITPSIQVAALNRCMALGQQVIASDPVAGAMAAKVAKANLRGFQVGVGAMRYALNTHQLLTLRDALNAGEQHAYDMASALHIGRVASPPPSNLTQPGSHAAYFLTKGMQSAPVAFKTAAMGTIAQDPTMRAAAVVAVKDVAAHRASWWHKLLVSLGLAK